MRRLYYLCLITIPRIKVPTSFGYSAFLAFGQFSRPTAGIYGNRLYFPFSFPFQIRTLRRPVLRIPPTDSYLHRPSLFQESHKRTSNKQTNLSDQGNISFFLISSVRSRICQKKSTRKRVTFEEITGRGRSAYAQEQK